MSFIVVACLLFCGGVALSMFSDAKTRPRIPNLHRCMADGDTHQIDTNIHAGRELYSVKYACGSGATASPFLPPDEFSHGNPTCPFCLAVLEVRR